MIDFKTAIKEELCQLCSRCKDDAEIRLRRSKNIICVLCEDCIKDPNHSLIIKANTEENFFG